MQPIAERAKSIFFAAIEKPSANEQRQYLDEACGNDGELHDRVQNLLAAHLAMGSINDQPPSAPMAAPDEPIHERVGSLVGRYKLLEQIGEGGMGVVFVAEQTEPVRRRVALKIIKPGMDTKQVIARFEAERQALAMMEHPNIARVLDAGTTEQGRPYFVMELVRGVPITDYCDRAKLNPRKRLELFVTVCHAIQHAHQKGVIHRDLKPPNILVTLHDGVPVVKVIDFGIAKAVSQQLTERTIYTALTQLIGTPLYMSPEQAEMSGLDVDTRSDVYSLGVLLYELLTGHTPFDKETIGKAGLEEIRRIVREHEPLRPSRRISTLGAEAISTITQHRGLDERKLGQVLRGELDWIVMKSLEKDRERRYESASSFAADIQRHLDNKAVLACPPSAGYHFRKFAGKHRALLSTAGLIAASLILGATVSLWQAMEATRARKLAVERLKNEIKARADAEHQQKRARVFLDQALAAIDQMLTRVSDDKLVDVPHMDTTRRELMEDALRLQRNLARENPGDPKVERALAHAILGVASAQDSAEAVESIHEALAIFQSLAKLAPSDPGDMAEAADCYRSLGWALLHLGKLDESEAACRESLSLGEQVYSQMQDAQGRIAQAKLILAYVLNARKKYAEAEPILREVLPIHEKDFAESPYHWWSLAVNLEQLGIAAVGLGKDSEAETFHRSSKTVAEKYLDFLKRRPNVSPTSEKLSPNKPKLPGDLRSKSGTQFFVVLACHGIGLIQERGGRLEEANESYREATQIATALVADYPNVRSYADWLRNSQTRLEWSLLARGQKLETTGEFTMAVAVYNSLLDLDVQNASTLLRLFHIFMWGDGHLQDHDRALEIAKRLVDLTPDSAESWDVLGMAYDGQRDYDQAKECFSKAKALDPKGDRGLEGLAEIAANEGRFEEALAIAQQAINACPDHSGVWYLRGHIYDLMEQHDKATEDYTRALELEPSQSYVSYRYKRRALALFKLNRYAEALADIAKATELNPGDLSALTWITPELTANCPDESFRAGIFALADKAVETGSRRGDALCTRAALFSAQRQYDRAQADLEEAIGYARDEAHVYKQLAWLLATCPDQEFRNPLRAVELAQRAVKLAPAQEACWTTLGAAQYRVGDWKAAITALEKSAERRNGGDSFDWFFLAMAQWRLGNKEEARKWYGKAVEWMQKNRPDDKQLIRFNAEALELLELKGKPESQHQPPAKNQGD